MSDDGTLVVRVTMNPRLRRVAFTSPLIHLLWSALVIVPALLLLVTGPAREVAVICVIAIVWCVWASWRILPHVRSMHRALSMGVPTLQLDELGVRVRDVPMHLDGATLAWADCAAVVVSKAPKGPEWPVQPVRYVQFVAVSEDRVGATRTRRADVRVKLLGLSATEASLTWLELPGVLPDADDVLAWVSAHQPTKRVVGAGHSVTDE